MSVLLRNKFTIARRYVTKKLTSKRYLKKYKVIEKLELRDAIIDFM